MKSRPRVVQKKTSIISICVSVTASLIFTPVLLFIALIAWITRLCVSTYLKLTCQSKIKLIDSMDTFQVFDRPNNLLETYTLLILQGNADITKIRETVTERIINKNQNLYEKLKCRVVKKCGYYCWENLNKDFDINQHVNYIESKSNNNLKEEIIYWTEAQIYQKISDMYSHGMEIDIPRWELVVIPNLIYENSQEISEENEKNYYAVIFRVHHSIMDGISNYFLLSYGLADFPVETAIDPLKPLGTPFYAKVFEYIKLLCLWPYLLYENVAVQPEKNCFHGPELSGPKIVTLTKHFDIKTIKKIRIPSKSSTVSLLNAAVGGAFNKLALEKGLNVPAVCTTVTSIPMLPYPNLKPQNRFSGAFFPILIGSCSTSERIRSTNETLKNIIESPLILMNSLLLRFIGILPASVSKNMTDSRELTCLTSNVPGPLESVYFFGGHRMVDVAAWLPIKNKTGFGICFLSYCGRMRASIVTDASISSASDADALATAFEEEISQMEMESYPGEEWA